VSEVQASLEPAPTAQLRQKLNVAIVGHVDHGKSTIVGRLLADTHSMPEGKLTQVKALCERTSRPFEYAFLVDALKNEQAQGITIDAARVFFSSASRDYILIDAPGHIEFLKNMVSGASRADAALLVIDAREGIQQNSRRHGYLLSMLGIQQIAVLVNKMDVIEYGKPEFDRIVGEYRRFLGGIGISAVDFIPVSGVRGDNLASRSPHMPWYQGPSVLGVLDSFRASESATDQPLRFLVQDVYKFTRSGDERRIIAGEIASGRLKVGDQLVFYPSGKRATVKSIEGFNVPPRSEVLAHGSAFGFTVEDQTYITRGEVATLLGQPRPEVSTRLRVKMFWLSNEPLKPNQEYLLRIGTAKARMQLEEVVRVLDASTLETSQKSQVERHEVADCVVELKKSIAFDVLPFAPETSRFVIVGEHRICGGGTVQERLDDHQAETREKVFLRNFKWERSDIPLERRSEVYNQKPALLLITGTPNSGRKALAKALEKRLFSEGKIVYYLGMGSFLYGVDADEKGQGGEARVRHIRRLAEVANILLDAGIVLIVTARELTRQDVETVKTVVYSDDVLVVWAGDSITTDVPCDLQLPSGLDADTGVDEINAFLQKASVIFKPNW
jgi:bifunctional enzyme CysN/CysC